ncbi:ABC transporter ATP-binding protein [Frankia sp. CNm7]|uniref:ABC transporter ATP-binding protein n=1 Tax=Frankia nepalensis TaxID=1836974 RepID=A0A937RRW1_9ACTN|nr:ABC transporter ATP-binding protein [Frankia nepalensis]MBL7496464.1 ABC transporter ATP-binding protein [Frankia nepalensis]MBL7510799.1 ABC transporter ATP-binding protein [Frankia nepalensis]MBL7521704.1 ABC transporter ATP-binding protein [Frankia nepalensis]MBL7631598.1 ABC transporter ATP-binding protein [Frankia nepalensis]
MALLETDSIAVRFGGNVALDDVSISVAAGRVTGLIGPNGAGKTTLFNIVTGLLAPTRGRVLVDGADITRLPPYKRAHRGLARTFQRLEPFVSLSVRDNVRVAGQIRDTWRRRGSLGIGKADPRGRGRLDLDRETDRVLELVGLTDVADRDVAELPTGQARLVELGRALMTRPGVLLLDEPASGQTEQETEAFGRLLRRLAQEDGIAVCLVEHDVGLVMDVCAMIYVLDYGRVIAAGPPDVIRADPAVIDAYLGSAEEGAA